MNLEKRLSDIVGAKQVSTDPAELISYGQDWTRFYEPAPCAVVFPVEVAEVQEIVRLALRENIALVPSGGRTGLSGGACATSGELVVSFDRMNAIGPFSPEDRSVQVQPGVVTANLQAFAARQDLFYPVDFASSGSSQLGGNIATNAGGIRVIRYGLTRQWVSGLRVVTGTGELLELNRGLTKNATGYDLRHLFVGSEGTLGFIVEASMQLTEPPASSRVMLLAVTGMAGCLAILNRFRAVLTLNAFEFFSENALGHVTSHRGLSRPFSRPAPFYVLVEYEESDAAMLAFDQCVADGTAVDGVLAASERQNAELWQLREGISESITPRTPFKNDISVRISQVPAFLERIDQAVAAGYPGFEVVWFGHIGDGNLHLNILRPEEQAPDVFLRECEQLNQQVLEIVGEFGGSVSAEHGVGLLKKDYLGYSRSPPEIESMHAIKRVFDPA
ncbi:MAG: FAD-binding oxidoreductase, partial [Proteobacteria bacterium]|nr:FAD-binding oxidoreductase [Pseudomonadota bacterium]